MMRIYSKNHRLQKIVQFVSFVYHRSTRGGNTNHAVERLYAMAVIMRLYDDQGNRIANDKCPYCRTPKPTNGEIIERRMKLIEKENAIAIYNQGCRYFHGVEFPQDYGKSLELFHTAAELGHAMDLPPMADCLYQQSGQGGGRVGGLNELFYILEGSIYAYQLDDVHNSFKHWLCLFLWQRGRS